MISEVEFFRAVRCMRLMKEAGQERTWPYQRLEELIASAFDNQSTEELLKSMELQVVRLREMPYAEYLETEDWRQTRHFAIERAGRRCQACNGGRDLEAHHRTYERLGEEWLDDLSVLCHGCHGAFHQARRLVEA